MQSLAIVDLLDEVADAVLCLGHIPILKHVDLFIFEGAHKTFYPCIVVRVASSAHADQNSVFHQHLCVGMAAVLYTSIRMVNQSWSDISTAERHPECSDCKPWFHPSVQSPANAASAESIQNYCEKYELVYQPDVSNIRCPELVGSGQNDFAS